MKKIFWFLYVFLIFQMVGFAQQPTPKPTNSPVSKIVEDDDVVKITTTLIQIDVSVTDKNGKTVKDLKPEDFEIYENQEKQTITNFSLIQTETKEKSTPTPENAKLSGNIPVPILPARLKPENIRRTLAFVIDDLNLGFDSIYFTKKALKNFVDKQMQDGDLIAIIRTGTGIGALQQFTSDKRLLYAAIENIRWNPNGTSGINPFAPAKEDSNETEGSKALNDAEAEYNDFRQSVFATGTLGSVDYVISGMKDLPGRKSIMLISDSLRTKKSDGERDEKVLKALKSLIEAANRSSVVIYTMSAKGIPYEAQDGAESNSNPNDVSNASKLTDDSGQLSDKGAAANLQRLETLSNQKLDDIDNQRGLTRLSRETGGLAIMNQKELSTNIQTMIDDQKGYYLIGYQPNDATFDAKTARFNKLTVKVNRPDIIVRYRSGFFGLTDEQIKTTVKLTASQKISNALTSPFAKNEINVRLASLFGNAANGSFVRSFLHIQSKDMIFTDEPDGSKKATFDVIAFIFGDNGLPIDQVSKSHTFRISPENYKQILDGGFVYNFNMLVKKPGAYQLRIVLRDSVSEKIGSASQFIEVPDLKKNRLTISGITLANFTLEEWQKTQQTAVSNTPAEANTLNKTQNDTALRRFKRGSILTFGYTVYNAKPDKATKQPNLQTQMRLFRDGKLILEGTPKPSDLNGQKDLERIAANGAISLANQMQVGEYVLQITVTDISTKEKPTVASQLIDFEVVE